YMDVEKTPQFAFGHGLSYTTFKYGTVKLDKKTYAKGESVKVSVEVTNTGNYDGKEVVQLYIRDIAASLSRPVKELKGFELVSIKKGETKTVSFTLTDNELGFFNNNGDYLVEPGTFKVFVGTSSDNVQEAEFELK
ncbi:fibronectin type III-like domain-contianing protein, partial [Flavobacterium sp.]